MSHAPQRSEQSLVERALSGERLALARLISAVEDGSDDLPMIMRDLFPHTGQAFTIGITGAPGAGKSTLTETLITEIRQEKMKVGVLAVDPSSPFSGGALLGDRVRMQSHATDQGVFIRSMATRGHLGGLALATPEAVRLLDAAGFDYVIIETVGVGQAEIDIVEAADSTVVILNPGWGDSVQSEKAGLLEIGDIFVINKADRDGTKQTVKDIEQMVHFGPHRAWTPPVRETVATAPKGVSELWATIKAHRAHLESSGELTTRRHSRMAKELADIVAERVQQRLRAQSAGLIEQLVARVEKRELDPYAASQVLLDTLELDD
jgi:LAO/AO transport system kinase